MTATAHEIPAYIRRPLDRAKLVSRIQTHAGMRQYLSETGSPYATHEDPGMVQAAFLGAVQFALEDLARAYEREIARHA